jgi:hypothetical protein
MMTPQEIELLLNRPENETLDFKATSYDLSDESSKADFIKDVLCMANTPRDEDSFIVLGVKKHSDGTSDVWGVDSHEDDTTLQSQFSERVYPIPHFTYEPVPYQGKQIGVLRISPRLLGPCVPLKDFGNILRQRQVYFRRGSKNDTAMPEDINSISAWIRGERAEDIRSSGSEDWDNFLEAVNHFERSRQYILVSGPFENVDISELSSVGRVPWLATFDFDPNSDTSGLLSAVKPILESHRSLHQLSAGDALWSTRNAPPIGSSRAD